jgi:hypothetical protein
VYFWNIFIVGITAVAMASLLLMKTLLVADVHSGTGILALGLVHAVGGSHVASGVSSVAGCTVTGVHALALFHAVSGTHAVAGVISVVGPPATGVHALAYVHAVERVSAIMFAVPLLVS